MKGEYDIDLRIHTGNVMHPITSSVRLADIPVALLLVAGLRLRDLDMRPAEEAIAILKPTSELLVRSKPQFSGFNCCFDTAAFFLRHFIEDCLEHPKATIYVMEVA